MEKNKQIPKRKTIKEQKPAQVFINPEIQKGVYSNVAKIHHTDREFVIDFFSKFDPIGQLVSRVILSPEHIKALSKAIDINISKFEEKEKSKKN